MYSLPMWASRLVSGSVTMNHRGSVSHTSWHSNARTTSRNGIHYALVIRHHMYQSMVGRACKGVILAKKAFLWELSWNLRCWNIEPSKRNRKVFVDRGNSTKFRDCWSPSVLQIVRLFLYLTRSFDSRIFVLFILVFNRTLPSGGRFFSFRTLLEVIGDAVLAAEPE